MACLEDVTAAFALTRVSQTGVSFAGKSLKLNTIEDAKPIVEAIEKCSSLEYLNMEGNTLGVEASKGIAKALEKHPEFKRALWKDMFTGRMKEEIPKALEFLGDGLVTAGTRLTELDLSDNAFGPIGVKGLATLLKSPSCYALEELRLNNNGLGITGGKLLASALTDCYIASKYQGKPLGLKVFIAGRNRLENEGAKALATVFTMLGSLEEVAMPQNGIYHVGISALSEAFTHNTNLQILNLNDNTFSTKGSKAISEALPSLTQLKSINFGDCLVKTEGASYLAQGLKNNTNLEELTLSCNEIRLPGGLALVSSMSNKIKLKTLNLDSNQFGEDGIKQIKEKLREIGTINVNALSVNDDEFDEDEDEEENKETDEEEEENDSGSEEEEEVVEVCGGDLSPITVEHFLQTPSALNFLKLGENACMLILQRVKLTDEASLNNYIAALMKVSSLSNNTKVKVSSASLKCTELLYKELFIWAQLQDKISIVNNNLLINLGLIKSEDKMKPTWNIEGCLKALDSVLSKNYIPESTKNTVKAFMQREVDNNGSFLEIKKQLLKKL